MRAWLGGVTACSRAAALVASLCAAVGVAGVTSVVTGCAHARFDDRDRADVLAVLEAQREAWNRGDLDGYMAGYERSEALVFTSGATIRRGWEATRAKYEAKYGSGAEDGAATMGALEFRIDEVRGLGPDAAVVLGHWRLTETPQAGEGVFSVVLVRTADGWKVVHDHTSAAPGDPD